MISESLFTEVLINPINAKADELLIISGYATSAMAFHHLESLREKGADVKIRLLVGMCSADGLSISNHRGFQKLMNESYPNIFSCSYHYKEPPVHSKIYIWKRKGVLLNSFIGSANYTQNAFLHNQREILASITDKDVIDYFNLLEKDSIFCNHAESDNFVRIYNDKNYYSKHEHEEINREITDVPKHTDVESVNISLLSLKTGEVQRRGGLNWGQRHGRNPNQAYLQLSPDVYHSNFFPTKGIHFTVVTDDSKTFNCTRAQKSAEGQAIETPHNNALLGEYFRYRMGLRSGEYITRAMLENYGRTDVTFYKFDDENFYMDFSVL